MVGVSGKRRGLLRDAADRSRGRNGGVNRISTTGALKPLHILLQKPYRPVTMLIDAGWAVVVRSVVQKRVSGRYTIQTIDFAGSGKCNCSMPDKDIQPSEINLKAIRAL